MKALSSFLKEGSFFNSSNISAVLRAMRDTSYKKDKQKGYLSLPIGKEKEYKNDQQKTERNPKKKTARSEEETKKESKDEKKSVMNKTTPSRPRKKKETRAGKQTNRRQPQKTSVSERGRQEDNYHYERRNEKKVKKKGSKTGQPQKNCDKRQR